MNWKSPLPEDVLFKHTLYKYRSLRYPDGKINTYTQGIFDGRSLWFDKPASFNDPFDCNLKLWSSKVPEDIVNYAREKAMEKLPKAAEKVIEAAAQAAINKLGIGNRSFDQERKRIYEDSSVFCWADSGSASSAK